MPGVRFSPSRPNMSTPLKYLICLLLAACDWDIPKFGTRAVIPEPPPPPITCGLCIPDTVGNYRMVDCVHDARGIALDGECHMGTCWAVCQATCHEPLFCDVYP